MFNFSFNWRSNLLFIFCLILIAPIAFAQEEIKVTPVIIEQKAEARDILEFSVKIINNTHSKVDLYPIVNDVSIEQGRQEFLDPTLMDKSFSLARWVRISRGVIELFPGEEKEIPIKVQVNLSAKPGKYYAFITFAQGFNRPEAEERALKLNQPQVMLNIEVEEHIIEKAQILKFQTDKNFFLKFPVKFLLEIENIGNREIKPEGSISIYDRKGQEIASIDINQAQAGIAPTFKNLFENIWQAKKGFGQYKAVLRVEYGDKEKRDLQDTVYFWVLPWQMLILFAGGLLVLIVTLFLMIFKKFLRNLLVICVLLLLPAAVFAQTEDKLSLTVTPPLIKINMEPGEFWSSSVKIVNINPKPLTVYAQILDFKTGKEGGVEFIQKKDIQEGKSFLLSQWLEVVQGPFEIPAFQSKKVPFNIKLPKDAEPGGHYAAILVGTRPMGEIKGTGIRVSSLVASLIMLNVGGDIIEQAQIREFSAEKSFYQKPEIKFTVRFENLGNVHVQPQGEIKIYNFFGKERGTIPINQKTDFGNVLPQSIRKWNFEWKGEQSFFDVGRYKAVLVLGFGREAKQTVSSALYFWVVPLKPFLGILAGFTLFIFLMVLGIRAYIKKAIFIAQKEASKAVIDLRQKDE